MHAVSTLLEILASISTARGVPEIAAFVSTLLEILARAAGGGVE
jgi:hypothetical protein